MKIFIDIKNKYKKVRLLSQLQKIVLIFCSLIFFSGFNKNDNKHYIIYNYGNQKYIDREGNVLLSAGHNQKIGYVIDEKIKEKVLVYKNYTHYGNVDLNYIIPANDKYDESFFSYMDSYYDYEFYRGGGNYDGGNYRLTNKVYYYDLDAKKLIAEIDDVVFEKIYDNNFYYVENNEYPKMYVINLDTSEKSFIGNYNNLEINDDGVLIYEIKREYEYGIPKKLNDRKVAFANLKNENHIKTYDGYSFDKVIKIKNKSYYKIYYWVDAININFTDINNSYNYEYKFFNLVDEDFNKVLKEDVREEEFQHINYEMLIRNNKINEPSDMGIIDKLGICPNDIYCYIDKWIGKYYYIIKEKDNDNKDYFYLVNEKGNIISKKFLNDLSIPYMYLYNEFSKNRLDDKLIFCASDENKLRHYYFLNNEKLGEIEYDKNKKFFLISNEYYAVSDFDISKYYYGTTKENETLTFYKIGNSLPLFTLHREINDDKPPLGMIYYKDHVYFYSGYNDFDNRYGEKYRKKGSMMCDIEGNVIDESLEKEINEYVVYQSKIQQDHNEVKRKEWIKKSDEFDKQKNTDKEKESDIETLESDDVEKTMFSFNGIYYCCVDNGDYKNKIYRYKDYTNAKDFYYEIGNYDFQLTNGYLNKNYVILKKENENIYSIYDIANEKIIIEGAKEIYNFTNDAFQYVKGFKYGLMDFEGNKIYETSTFGDFEEEAQSIWDRYFEE